MIFLKLVYKIYKINIIYIRDNKIYFYLKYFIFYIFFFSFFFKFFYITTTLSFCPCYHHHNSCFDLIHLILSGEFSELLVGNSASNQTSTRTFYQYNFALIGLVFVWNCFYFLSIKLENPFSIFELS